jgi:hypothetical protein
MRWPHVALIAVCVAHVLLPFWILGGHFPLGWDETVYVSQIDPHHVAGYFSAPRARGVALLTAPVSLITPSLTALRAWLAFLSGVGLYAGMRPWLRVVGGWTVPLAAALWSGLWVSLFYGNAAMPNQWIALAALAATGWFVVALREPARRSAWVGFGAALAIAALMRPSDSVALAVPLVVTALVARRVPLRHRGALLALTAVSLVAGWAEWLIEAEVRFGGVAARLQAASVENGGAGFHWTLGAELRALSGPTLCRYNCLADAPPVDRVWWLLLLPLAVAGIWFARRQVIVMRDAATFVLPTAVGLALAAEYFVLVPYAAPRFLLPAYLLLALPVAEGLRGMLVFSAPRFRVLTGLVLVAVLGLHEVAQVRVARTVTANAKQIGAVEARLATFLSEHGVDGNGVNGQGARTGCAVAGQHAGPTSYLDDCYGIDTIGWPVMAEQLAERGERVALVLPRRQLPLPFYATWLEAPYVDGRVRWTVWISPD